MFVVPLSKDIINTKDGAELEVVAYTNFKSKGPAVYVQHQAGTSPVAIYFFDIEKINGVRVEFNQGSKTFTALGHVKRKAHLPQVNDRVVIKQPTSDNPEATTVVEVKDLKLHSKTLGLSQGLLFRDKDGDYHRLDDIISIDRAVGSDAFNRKKFLRLYSEYRGYTGK